MGRLQEDSLLGVFRGERLGLESLQTRLQGGGWLPRSSGEKVAAESPTKARLGQPRLKSLTGYLLPAQYRDSGPLTG